MRRCIVIRYSNVNLNLTGGINMDTKNICKIIVKNGGVLVRINFFIKKH